MYTADVIEISIAQENQRLERERKLYDRRWKAMLKLWGQYHRHSWNSRQGVGKNILNLKNDTPYTNEALEKQLDKISSAYGMIKDSDRFMATLIVRFFIRETDRRVMCDWYHWDDNKYYYWLREARTTLRAVFNTIL